MRITIVTGPFYPVPPAPCGAVERLWNDLAIEFARRGNEVTVVCRHWPGQRKNETVDGIRYVRRLRLSHTKSIYFDLAQDLFYSLRMLPLLPRADVTVTNVFWLPALLRFGWLKRRVGKVVVNVNRWPKGQMKLYRKVDRLAAVSRAVADEVVRQCPACAPLVKIVPNPIDTRVFVPPTLSRSSKPAGGTLLYTGRVHPEKGVHLLVDAFLKLRAEFPLLRLRILGATSIAAGGGGEEYVAPMKAKCAVAAAPAEFLEPIYDRAALARELQAADYYCYPSLAEQGESFGVAPLEAMATGLAPVVSSLAVFRDFLEDGRTGVVFDHRAADPVGALTDALRRVIADPLRREAMGRGASEMASRFGNESVARMYLADFAELIGDAASAAASSPALAPSGTGEQRWP